MRLCRVFAALVVLLGLTGCTGASTGPANSTADPSAHPFTGPFQWKPGSSLISIDGSSSNDIWAVGESHGEAFRERSLVEHWDGSMWSIVDAPNIGRLVDVTTIGLEDVWAVSSTSVIHWDGATWDAVELSKGNARSLTSITAVAADDVWVAGERPGPMIGVNSRGWSTLVMHFDGHGWLEEQTPDQGTRDNFLKGVEALGPDDVWAAGYSSDLDRSAPEASTLTMHWDGVRWSLVPAPDPSPSLNVIWGMGLSGDSTVWLLGHYRGAGRHLESLILRWTGDSWRQVPVQGTVRWSATSASGASATSTWVIGSEPTSTLAVAICDTAECRVIVEPGQSYEVQASSVYAVTSTDAWLVGTMSGKDGATTPLVEHWDGKAWAPVTVPTGVSPSAAPA